MYTCLTKFAVAPVCLHPYFLLLTQLLLCFALGSQWLLHQFFLVFIILANSDSVFTSLVLISSDSAFAQVCFSKTFVVAFSPSCSFLSCYLAFALPMIFLTGYAIAQACC